MHMFTVDSYLDVAALLYLFDIKLSQN